jgi:hypothetical protein
MENNTEVPLKTKNRIIMRPSSSTSGNMYKNLKVESQKDICTAWFMVVLLTIAKRWKQPNVHQ